MLEFLLITALVLIFVYAYCAVNHLDYVGVQVAWISGPWFLSIFINMVPWESGEILWAGALSGN